MAARKKVARSSARRGSASKGQKKATRKKATRKKAGAKQATPAKAAAGGRKTTRKTATRKQATRAKGAAAEAPAFPELEALCALMERHGLLEVDYKVAPDGSQEYRVSRAAGGLVSAPVAAPAPAAPAAPAAASAPAPAGPAPTAPAAAEPDEDLHAFKSPMVGTFYRASSPEAAPFASVGDTVETGGIVCIIEAMKVMNEINPDAAGEVVSIEVENGEAVEFGQTLMLIRPR